MAVTRCTLAERTWPRLPYTLHTFPPALGVLARPHAPAILPYRTARTLFRVNITWRTYQSSGSPSYRTPAGHHRARHLSRRRLRLHRRQAQSAWRTRPHPHRGSLSRHSRGPDATPHRVLARASHVRTDVPGPPCPGKTALAPHRAADGRAPQ